MLCISNHTACRFAEKTRFFRSLWAGRRCAAASRFSFETLKKKQQERRAISRSNHRPDASKHAGRRAFHFPQKPRRTRAFAGFFLRKGNGDRRHFSKRLSLHARSAAPPRHLSDCMKDKKRTFSQHNKLISFQNTSCQIDKRIRNSRSVRKYSRHKRNNLSKVVPFSFQFIYRYAIIIQNGPLSCTIRAATAVLLQSAFF